MDNPTNPNARKYAPIEINLSDVTPGIATTLLDVQTNDVQVILGQVNLIAKPDPLRVAVGFATGSGGGNTDIAPWNNVNVYITRRLNPNDFVWYRIAEFFNLVQLGWYAWPSIPQPIRVVQVRRIH